MSPSRPLKGVTGCLTSLGLCCLKAALVESKQADERWVRKWEELRDVHTHTHSLSLSLTSWARNPLPDWPKVP